MFLITLLAAVQSTAPVAGASEPVARTPLQNYVTPDDYPQGVERATAKPVAFKLTIAPDGRVSECVVTASSGSALLDSTTCRLMRSRTRFIPASDASGKPVSGAVMAVIDWKGMVDSMSGTPTSSPTARVPQLVPRASWESVTRLRVQRGQISSCQWQGGVVPPPPSSNACQNFPMASMALRVASENKIDFNKSEVVVTLRLLDGMLLQPLKANPAALVDLTSDLEIDAEGRLTSCRFTRDIVRSVTPQRPDCNLLFAGPYGSVSRGGKAIATKHVAELRVEVR